MRLADWNGVVTGTQPPTRRSVAVDDFRSVLSTLMWVQQQL